MLTVDEIRKLNKLRWDKFYRQVFCYVFLVPLIYAAVCLYYLETLSGMSALEVASMVLVIFSPIILLALIYCFIYLIRLFRAFDASSFHRYILYLRPFYDDENTIDRSEIREPLKNQIPLLLLLPSASPSFDIFLSKAFKNTGFITVSLGNPKDFLPKPGTRKLYPKNEEWKTCVSDLIDGASIVFFRCADTENFRWELDYLVSNDMLKRSLMYIGLEKYEQQLWATRSAIMRESGIITPHEFPGFGVTVGFTESRRAYLLSKSSSDPDTYGHRVLQYMKLKEDDRGNRQGRVERG